MWNSTSPQPAVKKLSPRRRCTEEHNEGPVEQFRRQSRLSPLAGRQTDRHTDRKKTHADRRLNHRRSPRPPATGSERKSGGEQEIKRREDPHVWESERCERRDADGPKDSIWLRCAFLKCAPVGHWWNFGFKLKITLRCLHERSLCGNWVCWGKRVSEPSQRWRPDEMPGPTASCLTLKSRRFFCHTCPLH